MSNLEQKIMDDIPEHLPAKIRNKLTIIRLNAETIRRNAFNKGFDRTSLEACLDGIDGSIDIICKLLEKDCEGCELPLEECTCPKAA